MPEQFALKFRITNSRYTSRFCLKLKMHVSRCLYFTNNKNIPGKISRRLWCIDSLSTVYLFSAHRHSLKELLVNWDGCMHSNPAKNGHSYSQTDLSRTSIWRISFFPLNVWSTRKKNALPKMQRKAALNVGEKEEWQHADCHDMWYRHSS